MGTAVVEESQLNTALEDLQTGSGRVSHERHCLTMTFCVLHRHMKNGCFLSDLVPQARRWDEGSPAAAPVCMAGIRRIDPRAPRPDARPVVVDTCLRLEVDCCTARRPCCHFPTPR